MLIPVGSKAQDKAYDVFTPIAKYMAQGDAERLSAWFSDNLEITIFSTSNDSSRSQALQIMKSFFKSYTPRSFDISHTSSGSPSASGLGSVTQAHQVSPCPYTIFHP